MTVLTFVISWLFLIGGLQSATSPPLPAHVNVIGEGYDHLFGNTDGGRWQSGGVDPGIKLAQKIFRIETDQDFSAQVTYDHFDKCQSTHTTQVVYSPYSYQQKLAERITYHGFQFPDIVSAAFTLSRPYQDAKAETTHYNHFIFDKETTCITDVAHYKLSLAQADNFKLSSEVLVDICALPEKFDARAYRDFIIKWGTYVITDVSLGYRVTDRYRMNISDFASYVMKQAPSDVKTGGPLMGSESSYIVDIDSFKSRLGFSDTIGQYYDTLKTGTLSSPEPIGLGLSPIDIVLDPMFWPTDEIYDHCQMNITQKGKVIRQNLQNTLHYYISMNRGERLKASQLALPVTWPSGTYGLPKPKAGCAEHTTLWKEGWINQHLETQSPNSSWSTPNHLSGSLSRTIFNLQFCTKTVYTNGLSMDWPRGDYCIFKYHDCPPGFAEGFVRWDDEDTNNTNSHGGTRPDGEYGADTLMRYCCRSDGSIYESITLPTEKPFYLFQYKHGCQEVKGMKITVENLFWDDEDSHSPTHAAIGSVHPGMKFCNPPTIYPAQANCPGTASRIYYCYYSKQDGGGAQIIG